MSAVDEFTWLRHPATGGVFHCPLDAADAWKARGWEPCEPPEEPDAATAEQPKAAPPASTKAARRGNTEKE